MNGSEIRDSLLSLQPFCSSLPFLLFVHVRFKVRKDALDAEGIDPHSSPHERSNQILYETKPDTSPSSELPFLPKTLHVPKGPSPLLFLLRRMDVLERVVDTINLFLSLLEVRSREIGNCSSSVHPSRALPSLSNASFLRPGNSSYSISHPSPPKTRKPQRSEKKNNIPSLIKCPLPLRPHFRNPLHPSNSGRYQIPIVNNRDISTFFEGEGGIDGHFFAGGFAEGFGPF